MTVRAGVLGGGVVLAALAVVVGGCSTTGQGTGTQGFVAGSGTVTVLAAADRQQAPVISGRALDGTALSLDDYPGQMIVINVWASWCPPCRAEAPDLVAASRELARKHVQFVGIDTRDPSMANARSFVRDAGIGYPSIFDPDGRTLLGLDASLPAVSIPSTLVLDSQHRVAARVLGPITTTTLTDLVHDVAATR